MPNSARSARSTQSEQSVRSSKRNRPVSVQPSIPGPYYGPQQYYGPPQPYGTFVGDKMCGCTAKTYSIVVAVLTVVFAVLGLIGSVLQWFAYVHHWSVPAIGIVHSLILFTAGIFALFNVGILVYVILVSILVVADLLIGFGIIALSIRFQHTGDRFAFLPYYDHLWNYLCGVVYLLVMLAELVFAFCMLKARQIVKATEPRRMNSGIVYQPAYYGGVPPPISAKTQHSSRTYEM